MPGRSATLDSIRLLIETNAALPNRVASLCWYGHEIAGDVRVGDGDRSACLDLFPKLRPHAAGTAQDVAEAHRDEAGATLAVQPHHLGGACLAAELTLLERCLFMVSGSLYQALMDLLERSEQPNEGLRDLFSCQVLWDAK